MKNSTPGSECIHELSAIKEKYTNKIIYIYAAGVVGGRTYDAIRALTNWKVAGFFDQDEKKQEYKGINVYHLSDIELLVNQREDVLMIVAFTDEKEKSMMETLNQYGVEKSKLISYHSFCMHDLPIYAAYGLDKVFLDTVSMIVTERCTLKCEKCAIMLPYFSQIREYPLEKLKAEVDILFQKADFLGNFTITGGEPLLNVHLKELIQYVGMHYRQQIGSFHIITNGTLEPSVDLLDIMNKYQVAADISDYTKALPAKKESIEKHVDMYRRYGVATNFLQDIYWVDFGFGEVNHEYTPEQATGFFDYCKTRCRGYVDGKLRFCINGYFAAKVLGKEDDECNTFDLVHMGKTSKDKRKLAEFDIGYNNRGYLEMCQYCNGTCEINQHIIEVGKQCRSH